MDLDGKQTFSNHEMTKQMHTPAEESGVTCYNVKETNF